MDWKENKLGILSLTFALVPILLIGLGLSGFNGFYLGYAIASVLTGLVFASPILAIGFAIASFKKKEKTTIFGKIGLITGSIFILFFLFAALFIPGPMPPPRHDPITDTADALEDAYNNKSKLVTTQNVTFNQSCVVLPRVAIVEYAGLGIRGEQICLSLGDYPDLDGHGGFEGGAEDNPNRIRYVGGGTRDVRISVICYQGEELPGLFGKDGIYDEISPDWVKECECVKDSKLNEQVCCLVALRIAR